MEVGIKDSIVAIVTEDRNRVNASSVPVFFEEDIKKQEALALRIAKITSGMVHDLGNGIYLIVKH